MMVGMGVGGALGAWANRGDYSQYMTSGSPDDPHNDYFWCDDDIRGTHEIIVDVEVEGTRTTQKIRKKRRRYTAKELELLQAIQRATTEGERAYFEELLLAEMERTRRGDPDDPNNDLFWCDDDVAGTHDVQYDAEDLHRGTKNTHTQ